MNPQIRAIFWAQFGTIRNYLPRTSFGALLMAVLSVVWYGMFVFLAVLVARLLPLAAIAELRQYFPAALLGLLLFWQVFPVMTMTSGWSLELKKLLVYPIPLRTLFSVEVLLRLTTAPEAVILLLGAIAGLLLNRSLHGLWPLTLLLFIPFNLFLALTFRDVMLRLFRKKRLREVMVAFFVLIAVTPQFLMRTSAGEHLKPYFFSVAGSIATPWFEFSSLALGSRVPIAVVLATGWVVAIYYLSVRQFARAMTLDLSTSTDTTPSAQLAASAVAGPGSAAPAKVGAAGSLFETLVTLPTRFLRDPYAALMEKELRSLLRTPRFRVVLGMATLFSAIIFFPMTFGKGGSGFLARNYIAFINTYGMLILGEVLLWNFFGYDRRAAQLYYITPVRFAQVLRAKNLVAAIFIFFQTSVVLLVSLLMPVHFSGATIVGGIGISLITALYFMTVGNYSSVSSPRPVDPNQTFRRSASKTQFILLGAYLTLFIPIGLAYLAQWATGELWVFFAVLGFDLLLIACLYWISFESIVRRGEADREKIIDALSKGADPIGLGL
jgi:ABC-2 type transport system permease protein